MKRNFLTDIVGVNPVSQADAALDQQVGKPKFIDTALQPTDDAPSFDDDGYTAMRPEFDEADMLESYENPPPGYADAQLSPQEAYDHMKFQAPLSQEERNTLNDTPFIGPELTWVDDPDHEQWIVDQSKKKYNAMDDILEDQMYGEEPGVTSQGTQTDELGFGFNPFKKLKKLAKGALHVATSAERVAQKGVTKGLGVLVKKFVPSRDAQKAALIKQTNAKLVAGHAAYLMKQDVDAKRPKQSQAYYVNLSKSWAKGKLQAGGLPTSFTAGEIESAILGDDVMGSWWNPFSWFSKQTQYVLQNAQGQMINMNQAQWDAYQGTLAAQSMQQPGAGATDPATGLQVDPASGQPIDPSTGQPMDPATAAQYAAQQQSAATPTDPNAVPPSAYDPNSPTPDPSMYADPNAGYVDPNAGYVDPNAYTSGEQMSNAEENLDTLIFGDEGDDTLIFGEEPAYDLMVGTEEKSKPRLISAEKYKALTLRKAQTTSGSETPDVGHLVKAHSILGRKLQSKGVMVRAPKGTPPGTSSGAWLYKLNPLYWTKTKEERGFIDEEKSNYEKTKDLAKLKKKREKVLVAAQRAEYQKEQANAAQADADAITTNLNDIHESLSSGASTIVGGQGNVASVLGAAAQGAALASKSSKLCAAIAAKLAAGQTLTPQEIGKLRACIKTNNNLKKLTTNLQQKTDSMGYHDDKGVTSPFLGEDVQEILGEDVQEILGGHKASSEDMMEIMGEDEILGKNSGANDILGASAPTPSQMIALTAVAATQPSKLPALMKQEGIALSKSDMARLKVATNRAKIIMSHPSYSKIKLNKGALSKLSGDDSASGDDSMGSIFGTLGKILTAPLAAGAVAASALSWGVKKAVIAPLGVLGKVNNWAAKKGGWGNMPGYGSSAPAAGTVATTAALSAPANMPPGMPPPPPPPAGFSPQMQQAFQQRQIAAYQRIQAAQVNDQAAQQQLAASAAAADAEAQALDAEAQAQSDQQAAVQASYGIPPGGDGGGNYAPGDDSMGEDGVLMPEFFSGYEIEPIPSKPVESAKAKKITAEAQKNTPTGKKIRAGATLYHKAKKGDPKSRVAIAKMQAKAKKGDPQAKRDVNAVKAGKIAIHAKGHALKTISRKSATEARKKRFAANQKKVEAKLGHKLAEHSRRKRLVKIAKVEHSAAHGNKKAQVAIAHHVARAKAGDKKAKANVAALKLARHVRLAAKTPQDVKRQKQAGKLIRHARNGNKKAVRQVAIIQAAAKAGQPNAKRAMKHLTVAAHVERTVATGKVSLPTSKTTKQKVAAAKVSNQHKTDIIRYAQLKKRVAGPMGTREEALAAAKLGQKLGMKQEASALAMRARTLRSAKQPIKDKAVVVAAAQSGNKQAQAEISDTLASAQRGEPKGISEAGKIAGVHAVAAVQKGQPMPKPIAEATGIVQRAQAGDPEAKRIVARVGEAAQNPSHPNHAAAVETAVALTAASAVLAATASNVAAHEHWKSEARKATGTHVEPDEKGKVKEELDVKVAKLKSGEGTYADGVKAREMAMALGMTPLAAQISAIMPPADTSNPMSSLPDRPLAPITGWGSFFKEALKALTLSTPDPFENYREGSLSRGSTPMLQAMGPTLKKSSSTGHAFVGADASKGVTVYTVKRASEGDVGSKKKIFNLILAAAQGDQAAQDASNKIAGDAKVALAAGQLDPDKMKKLKQEISDFKDSIPDPGLQPAKM